MGLRPVMAMLVLAPWSERPPLKADSASGDEALALLGDFDAVSVPAAFAHLND